MIGRLAGTAALGAAFILAGCGQKTGQGAVSDAANPDAVAANPAQAWSGDYVRSSPAPASLHIASASGGALSVALKGASPANGAATAADCSLRAAGAPSGQTLDAQIVPFEADGLAVSAADVAAHHWHVRLARAADGGLTVETDFDGCGAGASLNGVYARGGGPAAAEGAPPSVSGPQGAITDTAMGGVHLGASPAQVRARFSGDKLTIVRDGTGVRFDIQGAQVSVGFDGEGRELKSGIDSLAAAGRTIVWDDLKPTLRVTVLETTSTAPATGDGVKVGALLSEAAERLGPATLQREAVGAQVEEWATFATDTAKGGIVYGVTAPGGGLAGNYAAGTDTKDVKPDAVISRIRVRAPLP